jgi:peptide/nickel transport system ATP-binding protein
VEALIQVKNLVIEAQDKTLVKDISFEVFPGQCVAIVGESGSGKTLSCMTLLQLNPLSFNYKTGKIFFSSQITGIEGKELFPTDKTIQSFRGKGIGMVFQEPMTALNPTMRVGDQIVEGIQFHFCLGRRAAKTRVLKLFEEVQIPNPEESFYKYPHEMSGGQRQRVMIAMAISCEPKVLLADEPTTALDVTVQQSVIQLLRQIQKTREMGLVFISHDLGLVSEVADTIVVMCRGEVVEYGSVKEVLFSPKHTYTKGLLACRPAGKDRNFSLPTLENLDYLNLRKDAFHSSENIVLRVESLCKSYGGKHILKSIDLTVHQGETVGLIGESGCGKSTLSKVIMGLTAVDSGVVYWEGKPIVASNLSYAKKLRKDIQMIFQDPFSSLNPKHAIGKALIEPMEIHKTGGTDSKQRETFAMELLSKVGFTNEREVLTKYPHQFSGGQRQRIVIARALACKPKLIICDESVSALDVSVQAQVLNLLNELKAEYGLTYLFITHDLHVARYMSNNIAIMKEGEIVEFGPVEEVFSSPKHRYTTQLLSAVPSIK